MPEPRRPDPDALLGSLQREEAARTRGRLKVFLGMCPGVGKTFAMLEAAGRELRGGRDVVLGLIETHGRKETEAVTAGIPLIPRRLVEYKGVTLSELDLDAVLARRPQLVVVDELAHTNAPGSRHPKRWQDVIELLEAGIDVFTTVNVQHVESRADTVRQITGAEIRETVPDRVLDGATLEVVDLPPSELIARLEQGKVYLPDRAATATRNFFRESNLMALRELSLRLVADHVGVGTREQRQRREGAGPWKTGDRLLVAVGAGPFSILLIRWTRRMSGALQCPWLAVHVEGPRALSDTGQAQLARNLATARELGAEVLVTADSDVVSGLLRVAQEQNVTQIVYGKPSGDGWMEWLRGGRRLWRLARASGDIDVNVVRAEKVRGAGERSHWQPRFDSAWTQYVVVLVAVTATALANIGVASVAGPRVPGLIFLLLIVVLALVVGRGPVLAAAALTALGWNFFFLPPRFTFTIRDPHDGILLVTHFVIALVMGQLVARLRAQQDAERSREARSSALYGLTRDLAGAGSSDEVVWQVMAQVARFFEASAAIMLPVRDRLVTHPDSMLAVTDKEIAVADWAFRQRKAAGRFTDNLPGASALHLPLATDRKTFGVLAVSLEKDLPLAQRELLGIFAQQAALALDRAELRVTSERARLVAESERLSRALLDSISHELRTPLSAISSAVGSLADAESAPAQLRRALISEIQEANARLNRIVGNLLDLARLEHGDVHARLDWHDARDLVHTTVADLQCELGDHPLTLHLPAEPVLVKLDYTLAHHAVRNLLLNAAMHTDAASPIEMRVEVVGDNVILKVSDRGPGLPAEFLPRIFDKFSRGHGAPAGGSGLGLAIAEGFIEAQGGTISAENRNGGGAEFTIVLPQREKPPAFEAGT